MGLERFIWFVVEVYGDCFVWWYAARRLVGGGEGLLGNVEV